MYHDETVAEKLDRLVSSQVYVYQRRRILNMLNLDTATPLRVCDVGCGEGSLCRDISNLLQHGSKVVGVDVSPFVLSIAERKERQHSLIPIQYILSDMLALPFPDNCYDIVTCVSALKYVKTTENEEKALQEQLRVLKPHGQLLVVDNDDYSINYEGVSVDSSLNKKVVMAYAATQGDPEAGNRLEYLFYSIGLKDVRAETIILEERCFDRLMAGYAMAENVCDVLRESALVTSNEINEWYQQVEGAANNGTYRWSFTKTAVVGRR